MLCCTSSLTALPAQHPAHASCLPDGIKIHRAHLLQACGFLAAAAEAYCDLQMPLEPWPEPELASGCSAAERPSSSPVQGAGGSGGGSRPGASRKRKAAWQPVAAGAASSPQQPEGQQQQQNGQQPTAEQQGGPQAAGQQPAGAQLARQLQGMPPGYSPGAGRQGGSGGSSGSSDERLLRSVQFAGLSFLQQAQKWRAHISLQAHPGESCKQHSILAHAEPMVLAVARDLAVFWRLDILKQQGQGRGARLAPAVLRDRWAGPGRCWIAVSIPSLSQHGCLAVPTTPLGPAS